MEPEGKLVGRKGRAKQQASSDVVGNWKTDIIDNRDPDREYQFFHDEQVRDRLRPTFVVLKDYATGQETKHHVSAWQLVHRETGHESAAGYRPDEGKPVDTVLRHGPMVCLSIDRASWDILQKAQGQRADAYEALSNRGTEKDFNQEGREGSASRGKPYVRITEQPLQRI
jgi:hypothetical protein